MQAGENGTEPEKGYSLTLC